MSTKVSAPKPAAGEQALQTEQLRLLQKSSAEQEAFKPYLYESMGLRVGANGKLEKIPYEDMLASMTPQERSQAELADLYLQRQKDALAGNLPVSPAMEAEIAQQQADMEENLSRRLGKDWKLSTSGIQSMSDFDKRAGLLREEARRGQITTGEGLIASRMGLMGQQQAQDYAQGQNWGAPMAGLLNSYAQAYQPYQFNRQMQYDARSQSAANKMGLISGAMGMVGQGVGTYTGIKYR